MSGQRPAGACSNHCCASIVVVPRHEYFCAQSHRNKKTSVEYIRGAENTPSRQTMTASLMTLLTRPIAHPSLNRTPFRRQSCAGTWALTLSRRASSPHKVQNACRKRPPPSRPVGGEQAHLCLYFFSPLPSCGDMCGTQSGLETIAVHRGPDASQNTRFARMVSTDWRRGAAGKGASLQRKV